MKSSPTPILTVLYNKRKVVVEFVAEGLSSFSSPYPSAPLIDIPSLSNSRSSTSPCLPAAAPKHSDPASPTLTTAALAQSQLSSPCARKEEPAPSSSKSPVKEGNLERLRMNLKVCEEKGEKGKKESLEKLRRKLDVCAQEIRECEEKEMDWAGGAGSGYIKAGKLKKKLARLCNQLEAHQGRVSVANEASGHDWMSSYLKENDQDPAESNSELEAKLNNQLKEGRTKINKVVSHFVERQERGVVCMDDDDSSIDLEGEEECQSIDDEEDIDDDEDDVQDIEGEEDVDDEDSGSIDLDGEEEDITIIASEVRDVHCAQE